MLLALVIITGEKNRETQSHSGAGAVRRAAADTGRRQTPAAAITSAVCRQAGRIHTYMYVATEGH
jgi:hypothetical protein